MLGLCSNDGSVDWSGLVKSEPVHNLLLLWPVNCALKTEVLSVIHLVLQNTQARIGPSGGSCKCRGVFLLV